MANRLGKLFPLILAALSAASAQAQTIRFSTAKTAPPPARMAAEVNADDESATLDAFDNISSLKVVDIAKITGAEAPLTYSGDLVGPYPGFNWFVSRHYAILSDMDDDSVRDALVLMELAWPHYVRTFQWRPPASDTYRQAIVLASSRSVLEDCLLHDSIHAKLLGGLTLEGFGCAYLYAGAPYQTRYILLHEGTHLYQYSLSGDTRGCYGFLLEGIADFLSSHIYDPGSKILNVNVLDRAPIHNHLADGLTDWRKLGKPSFSVLLDDPSPSRGLSVLMTAFLQRDKATTAKWHLFCERVVRDMTLKDAKRTTLAAFRAIYGEPKSLDTSFAKWMSSLKPTFNLVDRDFDQSFKWFFTALPPSNATARLEVDIENFKGMGNWERGTGENRQTVKPSNRQTSTASPHLFISRPEGSGTSAGFAFQGQTFAMSNTWSGGCVFTFSNDSESSSAEIPVAFMREHESPFEMTLKQEEGRSTVTVADRRGRPISQPLTTRPPKDFNGASSPQIMLFATSSPAEFDFSPLFFPSDTPLSMHCAIEAVPARPSPEIVFPSFADAVTDWEVIGPFTAAETAKAGAIPLDDANVWSEDGTRLRWRHVSAHPATPITPPLVNFNEVFGRQGNGLVAYAKAEIEAEKDSTATLLFGVADGAEVFLNGEKIATRNGKREWSDGNLRIDGVRLRKGRNRLLLKLVHDNSAWLLSTRLQRGGDSQIGDRR